MALEHSVKVTTVLGDKLIFRMMRGEEAISRSFRYDVSFVSKDPSIALDAMLGTSVTIEYERAAGDSRFFNGYVSRFAYVSSEESETDNLDSHVYEATLRPWLWFLSRHADCRIRAQEMSVDDIVKQVFEDYPNEETSWKTTKSYEQRSFCVQYRESDLDFVNRMFEDEGIFYYFEHEDGNHIMVIADSTGAYYDKSKNYKEIPYFPKSDQARRERDHIHSWQVRGVVQSGTISMRSFYFKNPTADLEARRHQPEPHAQAEGEVYDYAGDYIKLGHGEDIAKRRLEEELAHHLRASGEASASGMAAGQVFTLTNYPRADQNKTYLIVGVKHELWGYSHATQTSSDKEEKEPYTARFEVQLVDRAFRPARVTPRPCVGGPQTATVTGGKFSEIWTDQYARVKVQFHWDRVNRTDETSSCWIRVSQAWAGSGYGTIHIPRIGQEVIVEFLEGDPDQPIVTGRVYNNNQMPPYSLPGEMNKSGIMSRSTKGGGGFNEIMLDDTKGSELLRIHAQKNETIIVLNDKDETVHHDETLEVVNNRTRQVGVNEQVSIGANQTISVGANRSDTVGANESRTVAIAQQQTVGAARNVTVGAAQAHQVGGADSWTIGQTQEVDIGGDQSVNIGKGRELTIGDNDSIKVRKDSALNVGKKLKIDAGDEISIVTGQASIVMKKDGSIAIKGKNIRIEATGRIDLKASKNLTLTGQKILNN